MAVFVLVSCCLAEASAGQLSTPPATQNQTANAARILVVPFSNISGDPRDAWMGTGIAETIAADLRQLDFSVVSQTLSPEATPPDHLGLAADTHARQLAHEAGATWIVGGEFQKLGDQIRIVARVIDISRTTVPQTVTLDDKLDNLFKLQDQVVPRLKDILIPPQPITADTADTSYNCAAAAAAAADTAYHRPSDAADAADASYRRGVPGRGRGRQYTRC